MKQFFLSLTVFALALTASAQNFGFGGNQQSDTQAKFSQKYENLNYAGDDQAYHNLDVYIPEGKMPKKGWPVIVHIYGSAWFSNSSKGAADINTICAALLDAGYAVVCPNHRSSGDAHYPAQINDIKAVVRWVRGNAKQYHFDTRFIGTSGFSSGAHLASLCAATNGVKVAKSGDVEMDIEGSLGNYTSFSSEVNACCEWSGPIDLMNMDCDGVEKTGFKPEDALMGFAYPGHEDAYNLLSPCYFINEKTVPIMVFHGGKDNVVPQCQGRELFSVLQEKHVKGAKSHFEPEGGHGYAMYSKENLAKMVAHFNEAK
ncbi:MAG: alpha/beta hydrolase [Prevotellaceae bacterium]|nr:alpha/beta hydrolase [Candidatus Minthosoma equi]